MTALPNFEFSDAAAMPPRAAVSDARGSSCPSSSPLASSLPKPVRRHDYGGWMEWLAESPPEEMCERLSVVQREASVRMLLLIGASVLGPAARRERLDREALEAVKRADDVRHAAGKPFWA